MSENIKYRAILRDVAQVVIGELVSEDEDSVVLKKPAILNAQVQGQTVNLQFIPLDLVSMNPPVTSKVFCKEGADLDFEVSFRKKDVLVSDLPLNEDVIRGFESAQNPSPIATPAGGAGALVGPDGSVLTNDAPKAQTLF